MNEYKLYQRITKGDLRPHLDRFSGQEGLDELSKEFYSKIVDFDTLLDSFGEILDLDFLGINAGDKMLFELDSDNKTINIQLVSNPEEEELINIDIPPPMDEKSDIFLRIIEDEYNRIKASIKKVIEDSNSIEALNLYVLKNLQIAKSTAQEAHFLEKKIYKGSDDIARSPNALIIFALKKYIVYSIESLQRICSPILGIAIQSEHELCDELYEYESSSMIARVELMGRSMNRSHISRLYEQIGENSSKEEKIAFFKEKLKSQQEKIRNNSKSRFGCQSYMHDLEKLYESELGCILSEYHLEAIESNTVNALPSERFEVLIKVMVDFNKNSESIETKALQHSDFFDKIQTEIDLLKDLLLFTGSKLTSQNLMQDLISFLSFIQTRKHLNLNEDQWNDYLTDLLRAKQYYVADQSRGGRSGASTLTNHSSGELDITIRDNANNGRIVSIIETFILDSCGPENRIVKAHIRKLLERYDTAGNDENFVIVLSMASSFGSLWAKYIKHVEDTVFEGNSSFEIMEFSEFPVSDIKVGLNRFVRNEKERKLYHLFVNMCTG